jgi:ABC-type arginine/histidine transport system permease subunit
MLQFINFSVRTQHCFIYIYIYTYTHTYMISRLFLCYTKMLVDFFPPENLNTYPNVKNIPYSIALYVITLHSAARSVIMTGTLTFSPVQFRRISKYSVPNLFKFYLLKNSFSCSLNIFPCK